MSIPEREPLLSVTGLNLRFDTLDGRLHVLRGVDLSVRAGERVAVVGESGCGKSVTARAVLGLLPERRTRLEGSIRFDGAELAGAPARHVRALRGRAMTMIFQDPMAALNPSFTIRQQFRAVIARGDAKLTAEQAEQAMRQALADVSIADPARVLDSYSFQLSGGLNQRVMIAMGLANHPKLLIADEPGTALDVTVQEQTLRIMRRLSDTTGTAILFISHNLGVVRQFAHRVCVMYAGRIVEDAPAETIFARPRHPYTRALIASVPRLAASGLPQPIEGSVADIRRPITGCAFRPRCASALPACAQQPAWQEPEAGHRVACVRGNEAMA